MVSSHWPQLLFGSEWQLRKWAPIKKFVKYMTPEEEKRLNKRYHSSSTESVRTRSCGPKANLRAQKKQKAITPPDELLKQRQELARARIKAREEKMAKKSVKKQAKHKQKRKADDGYSDNDESKVLPWRQISQHRTAHRRSAASRMHRSPHRRS